MHNNDLQKVCNLNSIERTMIESFLQNKDFRTSIVEYILGYSSIKTLGQILSAVRISNTEEQSIVLQHIFTQRGSFFYILKNIVQFLNKNQVERINRDNVNKYLTAYETTMKEVGQFCYENLPISIYNSILNELSKNSSTLEKFVFSILAGVSHDKIQVRLQPDDLEFLFYEMRVDYDESGRINTPQLVDILVDAATPNSQEHLFMQISNLLIFIGKQEIINTENRDDCINILLRYTILRSAIEKGLYGYADKFIKKVLCYQLWITVLLLLKLQKKEE